MKILNLYAGIGGNRRGWSDVHEVTAVELNPLTAKVYREFFPDDTVIEGDAHQYLLDHYSEFDFIWSSPPCPTHSRLNTALHPQGVVRYPDMGLYQEIIFLQQWGKGTKWVIENVVPYYRPLIHARLEIERHLFWSNFHIHPLRLPKLVGVRIGGKDPSEPKEMQEALGIELPAFVKKRDDQRLMLRDITRPEIGEHVLKAALRETVQEGMVFHEALPSRRRLEVQKAPMPN